MTSQAVFKVSYDGSALANHTMDVRDLAPALMSIGNLVDEANRVLNGDRAAVKVQVKAHSAGSFAVAFVISQTLPSQIMELLTGDGVTAALNLQALLFGMAAPASLGLYALIQRLRGKKPTKITDLKNGTFRIEADGETYDIPLELLKLYQDLNVRTAVERTLLPLQREGVDSLSFIEKKKPILVITKAEVDIFKAPIIDDEIITDTEKVSAYSIVSLAFKDENKWRLHDGNNTISATIEDPSFLQRVNDNQVSFSKGDILLCRVRTKQWATNHGLRTDYEVLEILDHKSPARTIPMDFG